MAFRARYYSRPPHLVCEHRMLPPTLVEHRSRFRIKTYPRSVPTGRKTEISRFTVTLSAKTLTQFESQVSLWFFR